MREQEVSGYAGHRTGGARAGSVRGGSGPGGSAASGSARVGNPRRYGGGGPPRTPDGPPRGGRGGRPGPADRLARAGRLLAVALSTGVLITSGVSWYTYHSLTSGLTTSDALSVVQHGAPPKLDDSVNVLLIGLDSRKDMNGDDLPRQFVADDLNAGSSNIGGYNTNTLILLHIPAGGGKVQAFSIPRDDYVETYGPDGSVQGMHKIKEAYGLAKAVAETSLRAQGYTGTELEQRSREIGREATLATVQKFLGVRIDHFAEVNLLGFYDIAQVVQPITVCLNHAVYDPAVKGQGSGANFHAGLNTIDAAQALSFVRQRHYLTNGDLDRTHRQQAFISSVEHKLKEQGLFDDVGKMQALFDVVKKDVVIDTRWNLLDFAQQAPDLTGGNVVFNTLPIQGFATRGGESVNLVDPAQIQGIMRQLTTRPAASAASAQPSAAPTPAAASVPAAPAAPAALPASVTGAVVDVLNGSGTPGLAGADSRALTALGFTPGRTGNAPSRGSTVVRYGSGARAAAKQIATRLGPDALAVADPALPTERVQVFLGAGAVPLTGAAAHTTPAGPSTQAAPAQAQDIPFQGPAVRMGGIPCVN
ncbi:LCP family protein [Streptacidiphilus sp. P02-A3a]|uniref:LCP family protein n=1 Tax=Streptacidiphilus sp. P02-A3a TaxID=2704468 RepID=UPI001CDD08BB|nr:LCP family protein [Streptacidiphilus sp. P02-A3a]